MKEYMECLGYKAKDRITGLSGVCEAVSFDLYGCVQVAVKPTKLDKDGKPEEGRWVDHKRLEIDFKSKPLMDSPDFTLAATPAVTKPKKFIGLENGPVDKSTIKRA